MFTTSKHARKKQLRKDGGEWTHDWSENPWRYQKGDPSVIEMLLPCGLITQISAYRHEAVRCHPWSGKKNGNTTYVRTSFMITEGEPPNEKTTRRRYLLHGVLNNHWAVRDHINRDGLDNRDENVRDGGDNVNALNRTLKNDGLSASGGRSWQAEWIGIDGKRASKRFPWIKGDERSKASVRIVAARYLKEQAEATLAHILAKRPQGPVERLLMELPKPELEGFLFRRVDTPMVALQAKLSIDNKRVLGHWPLHHYVDEPMVQNGRLDESVFAMSDAMDWMLEKRKERGRLENTKRSRNE